MVTIEERQKINYRPRIDVIAGKSSVTHKDTIRVSGSLLIPETEFTPDESRSVVRKQLKRTGRETTDFKKLQKEVKKEFETFKFRVEIIRKMFREKGEIRGTYLALVKNMPERAGIIAHDTIIQQRGVYKHLYKLKKWGLVLKVPIIDLMKKETTLNQKQKAIINQVSKEEKKEIQDKFDIFSNSMPEQLKNSFTGKTHYWVLTELGRNRDLIAWTMGLEKEERTGFNNT